MDGWIDGCMVGFRNNCIKNVLNRDNCIKLFTLSLHLITNLAFLIVTLKANENSCMGFTFKYQVQRAKAKVHTALE